MNDFDVDLKVVHQIEVCLNEKLAWVHFWIASVNVKLFLKYPSQPRPCLCLHTGDCGEDRSYYIQLLARQRFLPAV